MHNNVTREDLDSLISYLQQDDPRLTHGPRVAEFEREWSQWLGTSHSVMVNSGSSANDLTMLALRARYGAGEILMAPLGWVSDVAAVLHAGLAPRFVDIDPDTLAADEHAVAGAFHSGTIALLLTHILGLPGFTPGLAALADSASLPIIEDTCESHGAVYQGRRCGSIGLASNFSFYYAHHLTTVEGGAVCTDDEDLADIVRMLRSHGMVRESRRPDRRQTYAEQFPDLNPDFIFAYAAHNNRSTELNAVLGLSQLTRLDAQIAVRQRNFRRFMAQIDGNTYRNGFETHTSSNYAFIVVQRAADVARRDRVEATLRARGIEFRRGLSGGGNQIRQPYLRQLLPDLRPEDFPETEHVHHFGWYVGNHPGITEEQVDILCEILNAIP